MFTLGFITQALFFVFELIQIRFRWRTYLRSFWNWVWITQFLVYVIYVWGEIVEA